MDYLDPKKKQQKRARLLISYGLFGVLIAMATILLFSITTGFDVDRNTGQLIQNGLIYVDSKPESARIILNGQEQGNRTEARLIVPEGSYDIQLQRDGYRSWQRTVSLDPATVRRINYARLIPEQIDSEPAVALEFVPDVVSQSIDKRWIVLAEHDDKLKMELLDIESQPFETTSIEFPVDFIESRKKGTWEILEWADNNTTFLASYTTSDGVEYMLVNRDKPLESINLASVFEDVAYDTVTMRNRKKDLLFLHNSKTGELRAANATSGLSEVYASEVQQYNSFGQDVVFITEAGAPKGQVRAVLQRGEDALTLRVIDAADTYLLEISKLGSEFVVGVSSPVQNRVWVYKDPVAASGENQTTGIPVPTTVLRLEEPEDLLISSDSSVIMARGGNKFASYEFEEDRDYNFTLDGKLNGKKEFRWLDGRHFTIAIDGVQYMVDYNGDNLYDLANSVVNLGSFFDKDIDFMFTFSTADNKDFPAQITRSFMRKPEDR